MSNQFKQLFNDHFYQPTFTRWRVEKEKAGKDIVGDQYEKMRKEYYKSFGLTPLKKRGVFGNMNPDLIVYRDGEILIVEEDKGHYVDKCFLERSIGDAVKIFKWCLDNNKPIPFYILSCPTNLNGFDRIFEELSSLYRSDLQQILKQKFKYCPLSLQNRLSKKTYFTGPINNFNLDDRLLQKQESIILECLNFNND